MAIWYEPTLDLEALTRLGQGTLPGALGMRFVDYGDDWLAAEMPVIAVTHQPFGFLHGGASVALAETVASVGGQLTCDPARERVFGMEINANHIRSKSEGVVRAVATREADGRRSQVWTIRITDEQDRLVCLSRITLAKVDANR